MKYNVLLVCSVGLSTSILVRNLEKKVNSDHIAFSCCDSNSAQDKAIKYDLIILAPHVRFVAQKLSEICDRYSIPVLILNANDYMRGSGDAILKQCEELLNSKEIIKKEKIVFLYQSAGFLTNYLLEKTDFKDIAEEMNWEIEHQSIENYIFQKGTKCILIESHLKFYDVHFFKQRNVPDYVTILFINQDEYLDKSGLKMKKCIENTLIEKE